MNMRRVFTALGLSAFVLLSVSSGLFAAIEVLDKTATIDGTTLRYKVVIPPDFDPGKTYPGKPNSIVGIGNDGDALDMGSPQDRQIASFVGALERQEPVQIIDARKNLLIELEEDITGHESGTGSRSRLDNFGQHDGVRAWAVKASSQPAIQRDRLCGDA